MPVHALMHMMPVGLICSLSRHSPARNSKHSQIIFCHSSHCHCLQIDSSSTRAVCILCCCFRCSCSVCCSTPLCCAGHDRGPHGPSRFGSRRFQAAPATSPEQPDTYSGAQVTPPARGYNEDGEVQSSSRRQANSAEPAVSAEAVATTERRATVDRECARLEAEGAPAGTRWASPPPQLAPCMLHPL